MIISHEHEAYQRRIKGATIGKHNGAYYYSREIVRNIIPRVQTDRNWVTINIPPYGADHAVVFVHNNIDPEGLYGWLDRYEDLIVVCGVPGTMERIKDIGEPVYLPLSIDVADVVRYRRPKTKGVAFAGRSVKREGKDFPRAVDYLEEMPRPKLLAAIAQYEEVYAVGRTAIEAACLGCKILPYDPRFPDPSIWEVVDNSEAAAILQKELNKIERRSYGGTMRVGSYR